MCSYKKEEDEIRHDIVSHMALAFFASAWADYSEQVGPHYPPGCEIMNVMPDETDPSAVWAAFDLCDRIEKLHGLHMAEIFRSAVNISEREGSGDRPRNTEMFGHYSAMSAMGTGVGLWDALGSSADDFVNVSEVGYMEFSWYDFDPDKYPDNREEKDY